MSAPSLRLPDGSRLSAALASWEKREESAFGDKRQRRSGRRVPAAERRWSDSCAAVKASTTTVHDADDDADLVAARLLSGRRRRRFLNECLLRELGGPLRAADIAALYAPVPWGYERSTVLEQLSALPSLKNEFLELREQTAPTSAPQPLHGGTAASAWARVGRRGRVALRRCVAGSLPFLDEVEAALRAFEADSGADTLSVPGDAYARLITHALCAYLGLQSSSLTDEHGNRGTLVRRRCGAVSASHALPPVSALLSSA